MICVGANAFVRLASEAKGNVPLFISRFARNPGRMRPGLHVLKDMRSYSEAAGSYRGTPSGVPGESRNMERL